MANPTLGRYYFSAGLADSVCKVRGRFAAVCCWSAFCRRLQLFAVCSTSPPPPAQCTQDAVTGTTIRLPMTLNIPAVPSTVVNSIALLTVPAAADGAVTKAYGGSASDGVAPAYLWTHVYKLFGYDAAALDVSWQRGRLALPAPPACSLTVPIGSSSSTPPTHTHAQKLNSHPTGRLPALHGRRAEGRLPHRRRAAGHLQHADVHLRHQPGAYPAAARRRSLSRHNRCRRRARRVHRRHLSLRCGRRRRRVADQRGGSD